MAEKKTATEKRKPLEQRKMTTFRYRDEDEAAGIHITKDPWKEKQQAKKKAPALKKKTTK